CVGFAIFFPISVTVPGGRDWQRFPLPTLAVRVVRLERTGAPAVHGPRRTTSRLYRAQAGWWQMNKARVLTAVPMAFVLAAATACGSGDDAQGGDGDTITV